MMALVLAAKSFDASRGVPFGRFAAIRIRGALTDELRTMDWASRAVRGKARELDAVRSELAARLGRNPRREEVAHVMGVSVSDLDAVDSDVARASVLSIQGITPDQGAELLPSTGDGPETVLLRREQIGYLHDAIAVLPDRLRTVVEQYFFGQRRMVDIAADLGVTESRVSQLRSEALALLQGRHAQPGRGDGRRAAASRRPASAPAPVTRTPPRWPPAPRWPAGSRRPRSWVRSAPRCARAPSPVRPDSPNISSGPLKFAGSPPITQMSDPRMGRQAQSGAP